jgi:hypothetical protein
MANTPATPLSDDELEALMTSDHRLIARLAAELLASRRELRDLHRQRRRESTDDDAT